MADYTNRAQQRIIRLVETLAGNEHTGLTLAEVSDLTDVSPATALRDLENLREMKWAEKWPDKRWCLSPGCLKPLVKVESGIMEHKKKITQIQQDYLEAGA